MSFDYSKIRPATEDEKAALPEYAKGTPYEGWFLIGMEDLSDGRGVARYWLNDPTEPLP